MDIRFLFFFNDRFITAIGGVLHEVALLPNNAPVVLATRDMRAHRDGLFLPDLKHEN
jgi:hypothetical protein